MSSCPIRLSQSNLPHPSWTRPLPSLDSVCNPDGRDKVGSQSNSSRLYVRVFLSHSWIFCSLLPSRQRWDQRCPRLQDRGLGLPQGVFSLGKPLPPRPLLFVVAAILAAAWRTAFLLIAEGFSLVAFLNQAEWLPPGFSKTNASSSGRSLISHLPQLIVAAAILGVAWRAVLFLQGRSSPQ